MRNLLRFFVLICSVVLLCAPALAEDDSSRLDYEAALSAAIERWDELLNEYDGQLTEQERFIAANRFTDAIQYAREDHFAMINAISASGSLEDFIALLNHGVIDPNNPCVPEDEIIEYVNAILKTAGYEQPQLMFVLHLNSAAAGDSWYVECGRMESHAYENGDSLTEPLIELKMTLEGEEHRLTLFVDTNLIDDDMISVRF